MYVGDSQEYLSDFFGLGKPSPETKKKKLKGPLSEIPEVSENFTETVVTMLTRTRIELNSLATEEELEEEKPKPVNKFLVEFLEKIRKFQDVYASLVNEAVSMRLLQNYMKNKGNRLYGGVGDKLTVKRHSVTPTIHRDLSPDNDSLVSDSVTPKKSTRKEILYPSQYQRHKKISAAVLKDSDESSSQTSSVMSTQTNVNKFLRFKSKKSLQPGNLKLRGIFDEITKNKPKMHAEDFKGYLAKRYNHLIIDTIYSTFNFRLGSFDDYLNEFNKLINTSEIRQLEFCFNIFDFNKDKRVCMKDAFTALEVRTGNHYDNDLRLIVETFDLKKEGKLTQMKLRRKSTLSLINEKLKKKKKDVFMFLRRDGNSKEETIFLTFKEFCLIKFSGRPQIFLDFIEYTTGYNFLKEKGMLREIPVVPSRGSEYMINQMNSNSEFLKNVVRNEKYEYYLQLESAVSLFTKSQAEDLLKKFKYLQFEEKLKYKVITKGSMIQKLVSFIQPDLLGFHNNYFSERFYEYFSEGKDLTKPVFFRKVYNLIIEQKENIASKLAFDLYDSHQDDFLTVDEVYHMFEAFPLSSEAYKECFKLISLFILSIFERLRQKLAGINFAKFIELIPVSILGLEIIEFLQTPFEECFDRKSPTFKTALIDDNSIKNHYSTRSSLLKLLN